MEIPASAHVAAMAAAQGIQVHEAAASPAEALQMEAKRSSPALALAPTPTPERSSLGRNSRSSTRSSTTLARVLAKTSPYGTLRTLSTVALIVGTLLAVVVFFGGLATMLVLAIGGRLGLGVGIFAGAVVLAFLTALGGKMLQEVLRLAADVGDRSRQTMMILDDLVNRPRDESL
jgi:hypothetical protein